MVHSTTFAGNEKLGGVTPLQNCPRMRGCVSFQTRSFSESQILGVYPPFAPEGGTWGGEAPPHVVPYGPPYLYTQYETHPCCPPIYIYIEITLSYSSLFFIFKIPAKISILKITLFFYINFLVETQLFILFTFSLSLTQPLPQAVKVRPKKLDYFFF